jgi:hypothetical protein
MCCEALDAPEKAPCRLTMLKNDNTTQEYMHKNTLKIRRLQLLFEVSEFR